MAELDLFLSTFTSRIDAKGRVSIPASFRSVLTRDGFEGLFVHPSFDVDAVDCGGNALLREIDGLLNAFPPYSEERDTLAVALQGMSELLKIDPEGRVILSEASKERAGLRSEACFVGMGHKFQIWEPERFRAHRDKATARVRELRKSLGLSSGGATRTPWQGARE
jgi:MraZ protein